MSDAFPTQTTAPPSALPADPRWYIHRIDAADVIVSVNAEWLAFAGENIAGPATLRAVGTSLWTHIASDEVQHLYHILLRQVRTTGQSVRFPFRCDSPTLRRDMQMMMLPQADQGVEFRSRVVEQRPMPYVVLLNPRMPRSDTFLRMCSWCHRVNLSTGQWVEPQVAITQLELFSAGPIPAITHAICAQCEYETLLAADLLDPDPSPVDS